MQIIRIEAVNILLGKERARMDFCRKITQMRGLHLSEWRVKTTAEISAKVETSKQQESVLHPWVRASRYSDLDKKDTYLPCVQFRDFVLPTWPWFWPWRPENAHSRGNSLFVNIKKSRLGSAELSESKRISLTGALTSLLKKVRSTFSFAKKTHSCFSHSFPSSPWAVKEGLTVNRLITLQLFLFMDEWMNEPVADQAQLTQNLQPSF